jgi:ketosteroid isomerase-like protein
MKQLAVTTICFVAINLFSACKQNEAKQPEETRTDIIQEVFPDEQAAIKVVLDSIFYCIANDKTEQLLSYHLYSPKFTEFRDGLKRLGSAENKEYETGLVSAVSDFKYELGDLKISVFGDVAVVTCNADFRPTKSGEVVQMWKQVTLVFVKYDNQWKITHEHISPLDINASAG